MNTRVRQVLFPVLAAFIWGTAFVAQSLGADHLGPFTFNAFRSAIATVALGVVLLISQRLKKQPLTAVAPTRAEKRTLLVGGICCGVVLAAGSFFQQFGLGETSAGKAGFLTALYIVLVPLAGLFMKQRVSPVVWAAVGVAVVGLYLLCVKEDFSIALSDISVLGCAVIFAAHILIIDYFAPRINGIALSCVQFLVVAVVSAVGALFTETLTWEMLRPCLLPLVYVGVFSSGVGYTLQILAQKDANPTLVSLLLSLESVFSVLAGVVLLQERMTVREYIGCVLMLIAVIAAQLPLSKTKHSRV